MTSRGSRRRLSAAIAGVGVLALLAGCSSGDDSADGPGGGEPSSGSTSASTSASPVPLPDPPEIVEPADGPLITTDGATIHGLRKMRLANDFGVLQGYRNDSANISIVPGFVDKTSLDAFARVQMKVQREAGDTVERTDDVTVGGEYNAFHLLDTSDPKVENHVYGVMFLNGSWIINIGFYNYKVDPDLPPLTAEEREDALASMLASFEVVLN